MPFPPNYIKTQEEILEEKLEELQSEVSSLKKEIKELKSLTSELKKETDLFRIRLNDVRRRI